jgi:hypothetical protein
MISQRSRHRWGRRASKMGWFAQFLMREAQVIGASNEIQVVDHMKLMALSRL